MSIEYQRGVPLKECTTLKIGGPAQRLYSPNTIEELQQILQDAKKADAAILVLGNGSNMLFDDEGYDGWIVRLAEGFRFMQRTGSNRVHIGAAVDNGSMASWLAGQKLTGYEFASGIPGTVGGAVVMNAGAYDGEIKDCLVSVGWMDPAGDVHETPLEDLNLSYRHSWFTDHPGIILWADFEFQPGESKDIEARIQELHQKRWSRQPMEDASAGSTFKRPKTGYASALIHENGLQGTRVGDAMVSTKHAGFLINAGNASAKDFLDLSAVVQKRVKENSGVDLELEVKVIPKDQDGCGFRPQ